MAASKAHVVGRQQQFEMDNEVDKGESKFEMKKIQYFLGRLLNRGVGGGVVSRGECHDVLYFGVDRRLAGARDWNGAGLLVDDGF